MMSPFTMAAIPSMLRGWPSAASAPWQSGETTRIVPAKTAANKGRIIRLNFPDQFQNFPELALDSIGTYAREFAAHKYKIPAPGEHQFRLADLDSSEAGPGSGELDFGEKHQVVNRDGKLAEAVAPIFAAAVELLTRGHFGEMAVGLDAESGVGDIARGNECRNAGLRPGL